MVDYIIVSISARALAESAKQSGFNTVSIDYFADEDTNQYSDKVYKLNSNVDGYNEDELLQLIQKCLKSHPNAKLVLGTGFESKPKLIQTLQTLVTTFSNSFDTINTLKNPLTFFPLLEKHGIAYPLTQTQKPNQPEGYLLKKIGGEGGAHISWIKKGDTGLDEDYYYQKFIDGESYSALFIADGYESRLLGINQHLKSNDDFHQTFLYRGAITLQEYDASHQIQIEMIIEAITKETNLKGLCGIDYILTKHDEIIVLEINPRPPATFELHQADYPLFKAHIESFNGKLFALSKNPKAICKGHAIFYATRDIYIDEHVEWPEWIKDKPQLHTQIHETNPVCTVYAEENSLDKVRCLLFNRLTLLEARINKAHKLN